MSEKKKRREQRSRDGAREGEKAVVIEEARSQREDGRGGAAWWRGAAELFRRIRKIDKVFARTFIIPRARRRMCGCGAREQFYIHSVFVQPCIHTHTHTHIYIYAEETLYTHARTVRRERVAGRQFMCTRGGGFGNAVDYGAVCAVPQRKASEGRERAYARGLSSLHLLGSRWCGWLLT